MPKLYRGTHLPHPKAELLRGSAVHGASETPLPIELDGEQPGTTPATFEVVRRRPQAPRAAGLAARRGLLRALERGELLLELRDALLELVDAAHLLREVVHPQLEVVERLERALPAGEVDDPPDGLLALARAGG